MLKELRWYLETALFLCVSYAIALLPDRLALGAGKWLGRLFFLLVKRRRDVAVQNISDSLPFLESQPGWVRRTAVELARETFENLGRMVVEVAKLYHGRGAHLIESIEFRGSEHFERAHARGKGVVFVSGHCGNWELMALSCAGRFQNVAVVAKRQENQHLNGVLEKIRRRYGNTVIYREGALRSMVSVFRKNGIVGMLIDQASSSYDGVLVDFLGRPAWTNKMLAMLARKTGAALVPVFIHREGDRQVLEIQPEIVLEGDGDTDVEDTARLTSYIEAYVIQHPTEWYWIHQRWKRAS